jgi:hypothetical protein
MKKTLNRILLVVAVGVIICALGLPLLRFPRHDGDVTCATHLNRIALGLTMYAHENEGWYPPELDTLLAEDYLDDTYTLQCPKAASRIEMEIKDWSKFPSDYVYRGAAHRDQITSETPLVADCPCNHRIGGNVLMLNNEVVWLDNPEFTDVYLKII